MNNGIAAEWANLSFIEFVTAGFVGTRIGDAKICLSFSALFQHAAFSPGYNFASKMSWTFCIKIPRSLHLVFLCTASVYYWGPFLIQKI